MAKGRFQSKTNPANGPAADRMLASTPGVLPQRSVDTIRELIGRTRRSANRTTSVSRKQGRFARDA